MIKNNIMLAALTTGCLGVLLSGCGPREETVVVQQEGPEKVVEKTAVKKVPEEKPKTIIVKPAPQPKTKTETKVKVVVNPTPQPTPSKLPEPAPLPTPAVEPASTPQPKATATPNLRVAAVPTPRPTAAPKPTATPKPAATPRAPAPKGLVVRAEVVATSKVPDPKSVPYKESLVFTKYKVLEVKNGQYSEKEILVAQWGMKDKKLQPAARNRVGQVQTLSLEPLSNSLESVMRNDDTNAFDLEPYFAR